MREWLTVISFFFPPFSFNSLVGLALHNRRFNFSQPTRRYHNYLVYMVMVKLGHVKSLFCLTRSCFIFPELLLSLCHFHWISQHSSWGAGTIVNCSRKKRTWNSNHFHEKEMSEHASWAFFRGGFWSKLIAIVDYTSTGKIILLCKCTCCMCEYEICLARKKQECMIRIFCFTSIRSELPPEQL